MKKQGCKYLLAVIFWFAGGCLAADSTPPEKTWMWMHEFIDVPVTVTDALVAEWKQKALAGDMRLKRQFAKAYFGCAWYKYKERCLAMHEHWQLGYKFLLEIIDLEPPLDDERERRDIGSFQSLYAMMRYREAAPNYDPASEACKDVVKYIVKAIENGEPCIAHHLHTMSLLGHCMIKNDSQYQKYLHMHKSNCPIF